MANPNLIIEDFSLGYRGKPALTLRELDLNFAAGEFVLVCGPTGAGKSSLLRAIMSMPQLTSNSAQSGAIKIFDPSTGQYVATRGKFPQDFAHLVGYVPQHPEKSFVSETVELELAFGMEQLGFEPSQMRSRVVSIAESLKLTDLLDREPASLSAGQAQRVAIAAALAAGQRILLLDEPTSALDDPSAFETVRLIRELCDNLGVTALMVEHRVERVVDVVDSVVLLDETGCATKGDKSLVSSFALPIRPKPANTEGHDAGRKEHDSNRAPRLKVSNLIVQHEQITALDRVSFEARYGEILGVRGANGAGKSSLLWAIQGAESRTGGEIWTSNHESVAMVPQTAGDLLFLGSVAEELHEADRFAAVPSGTTAKILSQLVGEMDYVQHPRDLSAGQQLALALAVQLVKGCNLILLDEPTSALDYRAKAALAAALNELSSQGKTIVIASHDGDFLAATADRILTLNRGRLCEEAGGSGEI